MRREERPGAGPVARDVWKERAGVYWPEMQGEGLGVREQ